MPICPAKPLRSALLALTLLVALTLVACGNEPKGPGGSTDGPNPAELTPADAPIYAEATLRPEGDLRENLESILSKLLNTDDPGAEVVAALEDAIASDPDYADFSYADDIEPWLGTTAGAFLSEISTDSGDGAVMVATTDADAAEEAIRKLIAAGSNSEPKLEQQTYDDVTYQLDSDPASDSAYGIIDDFLVVGTVDGFKAAVDASAGANLTRNGEVTAELNDVREDSVFASLVDFPALIEILERNGQLPPSSRDQIEAQLGDLTSGQLAFSAGADEDALTFNYIGPAGSGASKPPKLVGGLPADAWLGFAAADLGEMIRQNINAIDAQLRSGDEAGIDPPVDLQRMLERIGLEVERDLSWIGDTSLFVQGSSLFGLGAGLEFEATDEDDAAAALRKLQLALDRDPSIQTEPLADGEGFRIGADALPVGAEVELRDGKVVAAVGSVSADDVFDPGEPLRDSPEFESFRDKLGDDLTPTFYLDFKTITSLLEASGQSDPQTDQALQVLGALDSLITGSSVENGRARGGALLGVREAPAGGEAAVITP